jgi:hypothetical protein
MSLRDPRRLPFGFSEHEKRLLDPMQQKNEDVNKPDVSNFGIFFSMSSSRMTLSFVFFTTTSLATFNKCDTECPPILSVMVASAKGKFVCGLFVGLGLDCSRIDYFITGVYIL